jgi:competence ComEA-like helix-hairpin-helix protein
MATPPDRLQSWLSLRAALFLVLVAAASVALLRGNLVAEPAVPPTANACLALHLGEDGHTELVVDDACAMSTAPPVGAAALAVGLRLDINSASTADLDTVPGIGPTTAAAIVAERRDGGSFRSVDELDRVPGIGPRSIAKVRRYLMVK